MSKHGMVKAVGRHFEYEDGTLFLPFGTTIYAFAHQTPELIEETFETLAKAPFNKVRMCVFPKYYQYNNNEPRWYPWEKREDGSWNPEAPVKEYWDNLESIITRLGDMDIECDLILFHSYDKWGFSQMSHEDDLKYLQYCIDRLGHLDNIWWSLANEYDLLYTVKSKEDWCDIEEYLASHDGRHHLLSNHNCFAFWDVTRPNITHGSYQTKRMADVEDFARAVEKPIIIDECCYEGNIEMFWGSITAQEMTARFWQCVASGAYCTHGETFLDDNDVLWWAKGGKLKGQSPERIAFLREIYESLGKPLEPYLEPVNFFEALDPADLAVFGNTPAGKSLPIAQAANTEIDKLKHMYTEHEYMSHAADGSVVLKYTYVQQPAKCMMILDKDKTYTVEAIDTWNMTREVVAENVSGAVKVNLPGKPYTAVLAIAK